MNIAAFGLAHVRRAPAEGSDQNGGEGLRRFAQAPQSVALLSSRAPQLPHKL
jgi:hypothetical protein